MTEFEYNYERCHVHAEDINKIGIKADKIKGCFHELDKRVIKLETNFKIIIRLQTTTLAVIILHFVKDLF